MGFTVGGDAAQVLEILYPDIVAAAPGRLWHSRALRQSIASMAEIEGAADTG